MQGDLLSQLQDVDRVIRLLGKGTCLYAGKDWHCIIVSPFCQPLTCDDSVKLFAQVGTTNSQQCAASLRLGVFLCLKCISCCMPVVWVCHFWSHPVPTQAHALLVGCVRRGKCHRGVGRKRHCTQRCHAKQFWALSWSRIPL